MNRNTISHRFSVLAGAILIIGGIGLGLWALANLPTGANAAGFFSISLPAVVSPDSPLPPPDAYANSRLTTGDSTTPVTSPAIAPISPFTVSPPAAEIATDTPTEIEPDRPAQNPELPQDMPEPPFIIGLADALPADLLAAAQTLAEHHADVQLAAAGSPTATVTLHWHSADSVPFYRQIFAAATRFDTIDTTLTWPELQDAWSGQSERFPAVVYLEETGIGLQSLLGEPGPNAVAVTTTASAVAATWVTTPTLALLPFERLHPRLAVLAIDGQNPIENAARFDVQQYPFSAALYIQGHMPDGRITRLQADYLQALPSTNRQDDQLTVVAATGVTAMTRLMAVEMDRRGVGWPAEVVGPELAAADITVISNEIPFVEGCEANPSLDNLVFCSKPEYMETLLASGVTIVGLTGNHQNDFGWQAMYDSLALYEALDIPVYGGGADREAAMAPLFIEHNGNRLAFIGANSFGPPSAWATENAPGSAPFDLAILSATIRSIKERDLADLVLAEFQYQESYNVEPLFEQRGDFTALVRAGADIVTGVQSHVPQGIEFLNDKLVLYGLGNLYFDQMWSEATRDGMIVKHTLYQGRHLSTQILTTVIHDYGQPRWAEPDRRRAILERVFAASTWP